MTHKTLPRKPRRYPFERKLRWQEAGLRSLHLPAFPNLAGKAQCRLREWDRSQQVKKYA
jgi:hypothetical protein